jgi:hypothetical protein
MKQGRQAGMQAGRQAGRKARRQEGTKAGRQENKEKAALDGDVLLGMRAFHARRCGRRDSKEGRKEGKFIGSAGGGTQQGFTWCSAWYFVRWYVVVER